MAPRFKKNFIVAREENITELELRPGSMLFKAPPVKANNIMNNRPIDPPLTQSQMKATPTMPVKESLPIKQVRREFVIFCVRCSHQMQDINVQLVYNLKELKKSFYRTKFFV